MKGTYTIVTFGCQMNKSDSETMAGILEEKGYAPVDTPKQSDVILLNTCAVRGHSEEKAYSYLGHYRSMKEQNPNLVIGFTGCVAQKEGRDLLDRFSHLDFVMGPQNLTGLGDYVETVREDGQEREVVSLDTQPCVECGTCAIVADTHWEHPSGGKGVEFKQG